MITKRLLFGLFLKQSFFFFVLRLYKCQLVWNLETHFVNLQNHLMYTWKDEHVIFIFELKWKNLNTSVVCIFLKKAEIRETFLKFELTLGFFISLFTMWVQSLSHADIIMWYKYNVIYFPEIPNKIISLMEKDCIFV